MSKNINVTELEGGEVDYRCEPCRHEEGDTADTPAAVAWFSTSTGDSGYVCVRHLGVQLTAVLGCRIVIA